MNQQAFIEDVYEAYIECAFWADEPRDENGEPEENNGLSEDAKKSMREDVTAFVNAEWALVEGMDPGQVGHDFWLTRNHHGAGFWDRGLGEVGDKLTKAAHVYGESSLYVGDDGLVYV